MSTLSFLHEIVQLGLPDLGHPVIDTGVGDRVPGEFVDIVIKIGVEDREHLDKFVHREFFLLLCLVLEGIDIDLVDPAVQGISGEGTDKIPGFFCGCTLDEAGARSALQ